MKVISDQEWVNYPDANTIQTIIQEEPESESRDEDKHKP